MARLRMARRLAAIVLAWLLCAVAQGAAAQEPKTSDDAAALDAEVERLYQAGKYAEATEIARRLLVIRETALGPEHRDVATSLNSLANLYQAQGRYGDAEPLYQRTLA